MALESSSNQIPNTQEPNHPLITINTTNIIKLNSTNYITWSLQLCSLLEGYDLFGYLDGNQPSPTPTLTTNGVATPNPAYITWKRQDRLLFSAILGAVSLPIQPLLARNTTSREAWTTLHDTYGKPSRGHIKQIKDQLKNHVKGNKSISEYMQFIKNRADELALLGKPLDDEDLIDKILDGLGEAYKGIIDAVNARETPITFTEIYEKLLNKEVSLQQAQSTSTMFPATVNLTSHRPTTHWKQFPTSRTASSSASHQPGPQFRKPHQDRRPSRPYLGYCQGCGAQGHTVKNCTIFRLVSAQSSALHSSSQIGQRPSSPWQPNPQANFLSAKSTDTPTWLLDSGASHHVTADLANLSLHTPYDGPDDVVIDNGTRIPITHTGSTTISTTTCTFALNDILCVPHMRKNLISI